MAKDYKKNRERVRVFLLAQLSEGIWGNFAVEGVSFLGRTKGKVSFHTVRKPKEARTRRTDHASG